MVRRLVFASLALAAGCNDGSLLHAPKLLLRDASGAPADLSGVQSARIVYDFDTLGVVEEEASGPVGNGDYDVDITYLDRRAQSYQRIELRDASGVVLVGGTPWVIRRDGSPIEVIVGTPGTCEIVPDLALATARESASAVLAGRHVLVSGGTEAGGPSAAVDRLDLVTNTATSLPPTDTPLGPARGAMIDRDSALVLSDLHAPYIQLLESMDPVAGRPEPALHAGAESSPWVDNLGASGAVVVGTSPTDPATRLMSFVMPETHYVYTASLRVSAAERLIGTGAIGLWVGSYTGTTLGWEHVISEAGDVRRKGDSYNDGLGAGLERHGAHLMMDRDGMRMGIFGGTDQNGVLRTDTVKVAGCPVGCFTAAGPTWTTARTGAAFHTDGIIAGGDGPDGALVERVILPQLPMSPMVIEPFATLNVPRANPAVVVLPSGPVLVIGGRAAAGLVADTEICFPPN